MVKQFELKNLCCINCAREIENRIANIEGVKSSALNFFTQKLTIEADEASFSYAIKRAAKLIKRIEPGVKLKEL